MSLTLLLFVGSRVAFADDGPSVPPDPQVASAVGAPAPVDAEQFGTSRSRHAGTPLRVAIEVSGVGTSDTGQAKESTETKEFGSGTEGSGAISARFNTIATEHVVGIALGSTKTIEGSTPADFAGGVLNPQALNLKYDLKFAGRLRAAARLAADTPLSPFSIGGRGTVGVSSSYWKIGSPESTEATDNSTPLLEGQFSLMDVTLAGMFRYDLVMRKTDSNAPYAAYQNFVTGGAYVNSSDSEVAVRVEPGVTIRGALAGDQAVFQRALTNSDNSPTVYFGASVTGVITANAVDFFATYTYLGAGDGPDVKGLTGPQLFFGARVTAPMITAFKLDEVALKRRACASAIAKVKRTERPNSDDNVAAFRARTGC